MIVRKTVTEETWYNKTQRIQDMGYDDTLSESFNNKDDAERHAQILDKKYGGALIWGIELKGYKKYFVIPKSK